MLLTLTVVTSHRHQHKSKQKQKHQTQSDHGDYVCTETLKASLSSMFIRKDVTSTTQDTMRLCSMCNQAIQLSFLYVNDNKLVREWQENVRDNACRGMKRKLKKDCLTITNAIISSQDDLFNSPTTILSSTQFNTSTILADEIEIRSRALCHKIKCCTQTLYPQSQIDKLRSSNQRKNKCSDKKDHKNTKPLLNTTSAFLSNKLSPSQLADLSLHKQEERLAQDRAAVEKDWKSVQHTKQVLEQDRNVLSAKAKVVLDKEKEIDEAVRVGTIKCKPWQIPKPNNTCDCRTCFNHTNHTTNASHPTNTVANNKFKQVEALSTITSNIIPLAVPPPSATRVQYVPPTTSNIAAAPTVTSSATSPPPLPPGYTWQYKMVIDDDDK